MKAKIISLFDTPQLQFALSGATAEDDLKFFDGACPRGQLSTRFPLGPCNGCPLWDVCSDECGMNDADGYY